LLPFSKPAPTQAIFFLTAITYRRVPWFGRPLFANVLIEQWHYYASRFSFCLDAYCILPDHYHVVIQIDKNKTVSQILHAVHSYTATLINQSLGHSKKVKIWLGGAWDKEITNDKMYYQKVAYTLLNPWRAGLVCTTLDYYPYSNLSEWRDKYGDNFLLDLFSQFKRWGE
jgi:putative transposase